MTLHLDNALRVEYAMSIVFYSHPDSHTFHTCNMPGSNSKGNTITSTLNQWQHKFNPLLAFIQSFNEINNKK
jgi:hypothetical protein